MKDPYDVYSEQCSCEKAEKTKNVKHLMEISVPVDIFPEAEIGRIETEFCGDPVVKCDEISCMPGKCRLVIAQKICVRLPVKYSIKTNVGESITDCCG